MVRSASISGPETVPWPVLPRQLTYALSHRAKQAGIATHPSAQVWNLVAGVIRDAGRERGPEQRAQDRTAGRPPQRPPVPGELFPALPARSRAEPAGAVASRGGPIPAHVRRAEPAGRIADGGDRRAEPQAVPQRAA